MGREDRAGAEHLDHHISRVLKQPQPGHDLAVEELRHD